MRFYPSGRVIQAEPVAGCVGKMSRLRLGHFSGKIRFIGEGNYVVLYAVRAAGSIREAPWNCSVRRARQKADKHHLKPGFSGLAARTSSGSRFFAALGSATFASFVVEKQERSGRVEIQRKAFAFGGVRSYSADHRQGTVSVRPPAPFYGAGTLQLPGSDSTKWSGTLGVSFPGAPHVRLAGPGFRAGAAGERAITRIFGFLASF